MSNPLFLSVKCETFPIISYREKILVVGSCFAEHIGDQLDKYKFDVIKNPWGIVYNPISMAKNLIRANTQKLFQKDSLFEYNELFQSWNHHGVFGATNPEEALLKINQHQQLAIDFLQHPNGVICITFGSAWVYELDGEIVANCHKYPSSNFKKRLLTVDEIVEIYTTWLSQIPPTQKVIFTVSPVRYTRDGLRENQLSKSILHLSIQQIQEKFANTYYFPSYEMMMDELRDYRFYKEDLVHPSELAIQMIWERFRDSFIDSESDLIFRKWQPILGDLNHRILFPNTKSSQQFIAKLVTKLHDFAAQTGINVDRELNNLKQSL